MLPLHLTLLPPWSPCPLPPRAVPHSWPLSDLLPQPEQLHRSLEVVQPSSTPSRSRLRLARLQNPLQAVQPCWPASRPRRLLRA